VSCRERGLLAKTRRYAAFDNNPSKWIRAADAVCMTSEFETTPIALMEAAACGRPVVTTNVGGIPKMVEDGVTGLLCRDHSAASIAQTILKIAKDRDLCQRMGSAAYARWQRDFSLDRTVDEYLGLLSSASGPPLQWNS